MEHRTSLRTKKAISIVSIMCIILLIATAITFAIPYKNTDKTSDNILNELPTDGDGNELGGGVVHEMPKNLVFKTATATSSEGVTLQATVKPDTATNKDVKWEIVFVNPTSAWATGKTVVNYVTVTPTAGDSKIATVKCLLGFSEKVKIVVKSASDPTKSAECVVDYANRLTSLNIKFKKDTGVTANIPDLKLIQNQSYNFADFGPDPEIAFSSSSSYSYEMDLANSDFVYGEGTYSESELTTLSSTFAWKSTIFTNQHTEVFACYQPEFSAFPDSYKLFIYPSFLSLATSEYAEYEMPAILADTNRIYRQSKTDVTQSLLKIQYTVECKYYTSNFTYYMNIGSDSYSTVSGVELGNGNLVF